MQVVGLEAVGYVHFARSGDVDGIQPGRGDADVQLLVGDAEVFLEADVQGIFADVDVQRFGDVVGGVDDDFRLAVPLGVGDGGASREADAREVFHVDFLRHVVFAFFDGLLSEPSLGACLAACQEAEQAAEDCFCFHCLIC